MKDRRIIIARIAVIAAAALMIVYGLSRGEAGIVFAKAVNICFQCVGLE